ncbi:uncharacterized protein LOC122298916 [Carya illinoinensis]|uniref:uncharacterized protein LOC122298916 n=1 Tax=Carya illinoinensis TaxID=32201 RepID=UPI001C71AD50|nr:uncharacterized protein LOC122298916 [Carya illinoinensis]
MTDTPPNIEIEEPIIPPHLENNPHHPASPYYIQLGEGASSPLVPDLLTTENYITWARTMCRALNIKNKLGFIDGKILKPSNNADPLYTPWERCNDMNAPRIFQLNKSISTLTQDDDFVSQYYNKLKSFWDELEIYEPMPSCTCGSMKALMEYTHRSKVMKFLMGLHDSYDSVRAQILLNDSLPALNRGSSSTRRDRLFCTHCNISGHSLERCFKANPTLPVCSHCHIPGHTKEKCYRLNGFPSGHKNHTKHKTFANQSSLEQDHIGNGPSITPEQYSQLISLLQSSTSSVHTPAANQVLTNLSASESPMSGPFLLDDDWSGEGA